MNSSDTRRIEEDCKEAAERFRSLVESTSDWIWQVNENAVYTYASPKIKEILGYSPEEVLGKTPFDFMPNEEAKKIGAAFSEIIAKKEPFHNLENWNIHKNGSLVLLETSGVPILNGKRRLLGFRGIDRDVTKRKHFEEALRVSEEKFAKAFNNSPLAVTLTRLKDGLILEANDATLKLFGFTRNEVIGQTTLGLGMYAYPEDRARLVKGLTSEGSVRSLELILRKKDGSYFEVNLFAEVIKIQGIKYFVSSFVDITERKKAEVALKENEQLYRSLFENTDDGFMLLEPIFNEKGLPIDFRFLKVNPAYERQTGAKASEVLGKRASEVIPTLEPSVTGQCGKVAQTGKSIHCEEFNHFSKKWYESYYFPYSEGKVGILFRNISERKKAEEALLESEEKYKQLVDKLPEMVFEINAQGHVVFANSKAIDLLGYSREELAQGFDANRLVAPEDIERSKKNMRLMLAGGMRQSNEYAFLAKDGTRFPVLLTSAPVVKDNKIVGARGIVVDITERKAMERQLKENERLAAIGATAGMVGHDLRNPLQSIIGEVYLAENELETLPESKNKESLRESIRAIDEQIGYMDKIVSDLQTFVKPVEVHKEVVNLKQLVEDVFEQTKTSCIQINIDVNDCLTLNTDPQLLKRVLINLVTNSIQAMPNGGSLTVTAQVIGKGCIQIIVEDTGIGIPQEIQPKLFMPLFTTKAKGQGFGLAVCRRVIEAEGGKIFFESQAGKGTKFTVELPLK